jgi:hypothetical protein
MAVKDFSMNKLIVALIISISTLLTVTSCSHEQVNGKGAPKQETRDVSEFTGININGNYMIQGTIGTPQKFVIGTNEDLLPYIKSSVSSDVLVIENKSSTDLHPTVSQNIWFTVKSFNNLTMTGTSQFQLPNIDSDSLRLTLTGSHRVFLSGKAAELFIVINGNTDVDARNLVAEKATIEINGSSQVLLDASKKLNVKINGNGKVIYFNDQPAIDQTVNGSGQVVSGSTGIVAK